MSGKPKQITLTLSPEVAKALNCEQVLTSTMRIELGGKVSYVIKPVGVVQLSQQLL